MTDDQDTRRERLYNAIGQALLMLRRKEDTGPQLDYIRDHFPSPAFFVEASRPLMEHSGIKELEAFYFAMIPGLARRSGRDGFGVKPLLNRMELMGDYLRTLYIGVHAEKFYLVTLDGRGHMVRTILLQEGTSSSAPFYLKQVLSTAVNSKGTKAIVLSHNHPVGTTVASDEDIACTLLALQAAATLGIPLLDHIIIADGTPVSVRASGRIHAQLWLMQDPDSALLRNWTRKPKGTEN